MKPLKFKTHLGTKIINCQLTLRVFLSTFLGAVLVSTSGSWSDTHWEPLLYYEFLHNISKVRLWTHCINNLWSGLRQRSSSRTICSAETCKTILRVHQKNKTQTLSCMLFWGFFWRVMLFHRVQCRFLGSAKAPEKCWGYICCCWRGVVSPQRTLRKWCWSQQRKFFHEDEGMEKSIFSFLKREGNRWPHREQLRKRHIHTLKGIENTAHLKWSMIDISNLQRETHSKHKSLTNFCLYNN